MNTLQQELRSTYPVLRIRLLGVNDEGQEAGNASATAGRTLPWLQDVDADGNGRSDVTSEGWNATNRDVVILNGNNEKAGVYNLTTHNLADSASYGALRDLLVDVAMASQKPWKNPVDPLDVNNNGHVTALDVLIIINMLNSEKGTHKLPPPTTDQPVDYFYDCNGDGNLAPIDALVVINHLNATSTAQGGEGEPVEIIGGLPAPFLQTGPALADPATTYRELVEDANHRDMFQTPQTLTHDGHVGVADDEARLNRYDPGLASEATDWREPDWVAIASISPGNRGETEATILDRLGSLALAAITLHRHREP